MKPSTTFFKKISWLIALGGFSLVGFMWAAVLLSKAPPVPFEFAQSIKEVLGIWVVGGIITAVFGTPVLVVIDRYFSRFALRYIIGGSIAAWIAWLILAGPLFLPEHWSRLDSWIGSGMGHVGIYIGLGFTVGTMFTALVHLIDGRHQASEM